VRPGYCDVLFRLLTKNGAHIGGGSQARTHLTQRMETLPEFGSDRISNGPQVLQYYYTGTTRYALRAISWVLQYAGRTVILQQINNVRLVIPVSKSTYVS